AGTAGEGRRAAGWMLLVGQAEALAYLSLGGSPAGRGDIASPLLADRNANDISLRRETEGEQQRRYEQRVHVKFLADFHGPGVVPSPVSAGYVARAIAVVHQSTLRRQC